MKETLGVRNDNFKRAEEKRDVGTRRKFLNLEEREDSTDSQYGKRNDDLFYGCRATWFNGETNYKIGRE